MGKIIGIDLGTTNSCVAVMEGGKPIDALNKPFDPNFHNAVMHVEDEEIEESTVVEEFQKGYIYKEHVIRYSMVKVAN